jgi:hypothetical protein
MTSRIAKLSLSSQDAGKGIPAKQFQTQNNKVIAQLAARVWKTHGMQKHVMVELDSDNTQLCSGAIIVHRSAAHEDWPISHDACGVLVWVGFRTTTRIHIIISSKAHIRCFTKHWYICSAKQKCMR